MSIKARFKVRHGEFLLDVNLDIPGRGITALFGPSGCGKTTLLRAIAGLDHHPEGELSVEEMHWQTQDRFTPPHQRSLGYVFQEASLFSHLDVQQNLSYALKRVPKDEQQFSLEQLADLLNLSSLMHRRPDTLSGGEQRRVAIGRALAASPRLLLLDEPLAGLDQARKAEILPYLLEVQNTLEIPLIYVSHSLNEVARLADHLVLLEKGRCTAAGPVHDITTRLDLPLANMANAAAIVDAEISGHDEQYHLTELKFAGGTFTVPMENLAAGSTLRLQLAARDISLALEHQTGTSILNIFPATVDALAPYGPAQVTVRLMSGNVPLLARITRKSASTLGLKPGQMVYAQAKSIALLS